ncbi:MAG: type I restriction endonuclease subunit R, partial [Candidatus Diapherotrites archaeon]|nr:type I restriction endonuclease subunit R [Candidatus Diapherotrites archaeon]
KHLGWVEIDTQRADELRPSLKEPVLTEILRKKIKELNGWISEENTSRVIRSITGVQAASVLEANERIQAMLEKGTTVRQDKKDGLGLKSHDVHLMDCKNIENNDFNVVRQFKVLHYKENKPDIVLFINGLPVVVIECKSPAIQNPLEQGMVQIFRYQESQDSYRNTGCPKLFNTAQIVVSTYNYKLKYATNFTKERHWSEWKEAYPLKLDDLQKILGRTPYSQDIFLFGVCSKKHLIDIIQNYIVYEKEKGKIVKKICKYQQFKAVAKLIKKISQKKTAKGGVVWHTQGSGKSLSMLWTAVKLRKMQEPANPTIVIVTDRTDLDDQIRGTFQRCGFSNPVQTKSAKHLQELLADPVGQTIMTTIQKFQDATDEYPTLSENFDIFVLVDEAHRTQYKTLGANMRKAVPNATFIGFTGTPISKKYRSTKETFGDYVDVYDHRQAVKDGATVDIFYEGRMPELTITGNSIDEIFDRVFADYSQKDKERIKKKYATPEAIATAATRIKLICVDIIKHFETHIQPNKFKAQIVACSRRAAIIYKQALDDLNAPSSEVLISKNHNDESEFIPHHKSKTEEREVIRRFKEENDPQIIVVCDKLLTGFDAPIEQVMYLDSPLKEHTLLQAIARVNRTYKNKKYGLIVDYWGVSQDLQDALDMFTVEESKGMIHTDYKKEILPRLQAAHNAAMNFFMDVDKKDTEACVQSLAPEDIRVTFDQRFKLFSNYMDMLFPDPTAIPFIKDLKWLAEIRTRAKNKYRDEQLSLRECSDKVRQLIEEHIKAEGITHLAEPTSIFTEKFDEEIERLTSDEAKASEIEHAVKHEITFKVYEDPVYYESLRERLDRILHDFKAGRMDAAEQLELLKEILGEIRHPEKQAEKTGIDLKVFPFYNILSETSDNMIVMEQQATYGEQKSLKGISNEIFKALDELAVVDWQMKEDIKREMRRQIKRVLRANNYPADKIESITVKLLDLARARFVR